MTKLEHGADSAHALAAGLREHLRRTRLFSPHDALLVALSGGLDSVVLLHLLRFGLRHGLTMGAGKSEPVARSSGALYAAHFDHGMRADSAADATWVAGLCNAWQVPLVSGHAQHPLRSEAEARTARYAFLESAADEVGANVILTAHHADDQAETVLFRLARGTGLAGLAGIHARRGRLARPLLAFRRPRLAAYARSHRLRYRVDPSNVDLRFARNRIRHLLVPALERAAPEIVERLTRLANSAEAAERSWRAVARELLQRAVIARDAQDLTLARDTILGYHPRVRARVLRTALTDLGPVPGRAGTRAIVEFISSGASGGSIQLRGGVRLERSFDSLIIRSPARRTEENCPLVINAPGQGRAEARIGGRRFTVEWAATGRDDDGHTAVFEPSALRFPIELRAWRPGDRIRLGYGHKKLKKLFAERRVAREMRNRIPVLADAEGRVLWVVGIARCAGAAPSRTEPSRTAIMTIAVRPHDGD